MFHFHSPREHWQLRCQLDLPDEFHYASLPLCVIDAVFSIGVTYTSTQATVARFADRQGWALGPVPDRETGEHPIRDLITILSGVSPQEAAETLFGNRQRTSSRSGILKAEAVGRFARVLLDHGIDDFPDATAERLAQAEPHIKQIPGQRSGISFDYFRMLAGDEGFIKPDRMVLRYIAKAISVDDKTITPDLARLVLPMVTETLNLANGFRWSNRTLDYAVWKTTSA